MLPKFAGVCSCGMAIVLPGLCVTLRKLLNGFVFLWMGLVVNCSACPLFLHTLVRITLLKSCSILVVAPAGLRNCVPQSDVNVLSHIHFALIKFLRCFKYISLFSIVCNPQSFALFPFIRSVSCVSAIVVSVLCK